MAYYGFGIYLKEVVCDFPFKSAGVAFLLIGLGIAIGTYAAS